MLEHGFVHAHSGVQHLSHARRGVGLLHPAPRVFQPGVDERPLGDDARPKERRYGLVWQRFRVRLRQIEYGARKGRPSEAMGLDERNRQL